MSRRAVSAATSLSPNKKSFNPLKGRQVNKSHFSSGVVDKSEREEQLAHNRLVVKLFEGSQLLASDAETGKSDPVCFMWVGPEGPGMPNWDDESVLLSAVCPTTVDPIWRSEHTFYLDALRPTDRLIIFVRDEDIEPDGTISYDDLGVIEYTLKDILSMGKKMNNSGVVLGPVWKELSKYPGMRRVDGKIKLTITMHFGNSEESKQAVIDGMLIEGSDPARPLSELIDSVQRRLDPSAHPLRQPSPARPVSASRASPRRPPSASRSRSASRASTPALAPDKPPLDELVLDMVEEVVEGEIALPPPDGGDEAFPSFESMKNTVTNFFNGVPMQPQENINTSTDVPVEVVPHSSSSQVDSAAPANGEGKDSAPNIDTDSAVAKPSTKSAITEQPLHAVSNSLDSPYAPAVPVATTGGTANTSANSSTQHPVAAPADSTAVTDPSSAVAVPPKSSSMAERPSLGAAATGALHAATLRISDIHVKDLKDTGSMLDKQDPAVRITVCGIKKETDRKKDAGTAASFGEVLDFDVSEEGTEILVSIDVLNKKSSNEGKSLIGNGSAKINMLVGETVTEHVVNLDIGGKKQGTVTFRCMRSNSAGTNTEALEKPAAATDPSAPAVPVAATAVAATGQQSNTQKTDEPTSFEKKGEVEISQSAKAPPVVGSNEDTLLAALRKQLEQATIDTLTAQIELERLTKEVEVKALQAQLKQTAHQKESVTRQMDGLKRVLCQMHETNDGIAGIPTVDADVDAHVKIGATEPVAPAKTTTSATKIKQSKLTAEKKRKEDAKARLAAAKMKIAESGEGDKTVIVVKSKKSAINDYMDRDTDEEEGDEDLELVRQNTIRNRSINANSGKRAVYYPDGDDELVVMQEGDTPNGKDKQKSAIMSTEDTVDESPVDDVLRYPYRGKRGLSRSAEPASPLPPDTYPLRPSSSVLRELSELKKSTEAAVDALLSKLNILERALSTTELDPDEPQPESTDVRHISREGHRHSEKEMFCKTAPASMQHTPDLYEPELYRYEHPPELRSNKLNWGEISKCLQRNDVHSAMAEVLAHGYSEDVLCLINKLGPIPHKLSIAHRNSVFETISRVLSDPGNLAYAAPHFSQQQNKKIDVCMSWVLALVNEGITKSLTRGCHARLLGALNKVSQLQANNSGVMACRFEQELRHQTN